MSPEKALVGRLPDLIIAGESSYEPFAIFRRALIAQKHDVECELVLSGRPLIGKLFRELSDFVRILWVVFVILFKPLPERCHVINSTRALRCEVKIWSAEELSI